MAISAVPDEPISEVDAYVKRLVDDAPPVSAETLAQLSTLLGPVLPAVEAPKPAPRRRAA